MFGKESQTAPDIFTVFGNKFIKGVILKGHFFIQCCSVEFTIFAYRDCISAADIVRLTDTCWITCCQSESPPQIPNMDDLQQSITAVKQIQSFAGHNIGNEIFASAADIIQRQFARSGNTARPQNRSPQVSCFNCRKHRHISGNFALKTIVFCMSPEVFFVSRNILQRCIYPHRTALDIAVIKLVEFRQNIDRFR